MVARLDDLLKQVPFVLQRCLDRSAVRGMVRGLLTIDPDLWGSSGAWMMGVSKR